jgi:hypothetical protein
LALRLRDQLGIGECAPLGFRDTHDLMAGKSLLKARINALV